MQAAIKSSSSIESCQVVTQKCLKITGNQGHFVFGIYLYLGKADGEKSNGEKGCG